VSYSYGQREREGTAFSFFPSQATCDASYVFITILIKLASTKEMRELRSALFWDITQRIVEIPYRRQVPSSRVEGKLSRNVGKEIPLYSA
jgi:hypothetical protein